MFSSREDASPAVPGEPSDDDLGVDTGTDIIVRDDSADLSRALDVVSTLPQPAPRAHAMTSVLFQEPVLPVPEIVRDARDDDREDDDRDSRGGGKSVARAMVVCHVTARRGTRTRALPPVAISTV